MTAYEFDWVDAFAEVPFGGNPCVVVHGADDLSVDMRTALVRETRLSECAYVVASDVADFGARYYLAEREILMAGHPTVATVASLIDRGLVRLSDGCASFTLEVGAGVMAIEVVDGLITMTQRAPEFIRVYEPGEIAAIYGLGEADVVGRPQVVSTGTPFCVTVLASKEALGRAVLNHDLLTAWQDANGHAQARTMEPYLVTLGGLAGGDTFSRLLLPPPMPAEDPFTGSATGTMGAYLWAHGLIDAPRFTAEQGHWMDRPGQAVVEVLGPRDDISGVKVGGRAKILMRGHLQL